MMSKWFQSCFATVKLQNKKPLDEVGGNLPVGFEYTLRTYCHTRLLIEKIPYVKIEIIFIINLFIFNKNKRRIVLLFKFAKDFYSLIILWMLLLI